MNYRVCYKLMIDIFQTVLALIERTFLINTY